MLIDIPRATTARWLTVAVGAMMMVIGSSLAGAQTQQASDDARHYETRADLEAQAKQAEAQHRTGEAWLLRNRLKDGDFQEGDRILFGLQAGNQLIGLTGSATRMDTLVVRAGKVLQFPQLPDLQLDGVLRSELSDRISQHLAEFVRDPSVRVMPLLRIGILGRVIRQGYYYTSADVLLADVLMLAGGPQPDGDLRNVTIRRGGEVIWNSQDVRAALADGLTLDRLHLRAGDEVEVGQQRQFSWLVAVQVAAAVVGIVTLIRVR